MWPFLFGMELSLCFSQSLSELCGWKPMRYSNTPLIMPVSIQRPVCLRICLCLFCFSPFISLRSLCAIMIQASSYPQKLIWTFHNELRRHYIQTCKQKSDIKNWDLLQNKHERKTLYLFSTRSCGFTLGKHWIYIWAKLNAYVSGFTICEQMLLLGLQCDSCNACNVLSNTVWALGNQIVLNFVESVLFDQWTSLI